MPLHPAKPTQISPENLLQETSIGLAALEVAAAAFCKGSVITEEIVEEHASKYQAPEHNKMFQFFDKLRAYGYEDRPCSVRADETWNAFGFVFSLKELVDFFDVGSIDACNAVLQTAWARDKLNELDSTRGRVMISSGEHAEDVPDGMASGLTVHEISLLTGMEEQSIRNKLSQDKSIPRAVGNDSKQVEVPLEFAKDWLQGKGRFQSYQPPRSDSQLSVPVAKDGSFFNVNLKRKKGFTVGKKGEEEHFETFKEALIALDRMPTPYWRRPSKSTGVHGIVKGVKWESKSRKELGID